MRTIIQLDEKALEWLWNNAGDEFKVEIRNAVLQNFSNKFLKGVFDTEIAETAKKSIENLAYGYKSAINTTVKQIFNEMLKTHFVVSLWDKEAIDRLTNDPQVRSNLFENVQRMILETVENEINKMLNGGKLETVVREVAMEKLKKQIIKQLSE